MVVSHTLKIRRIGFIHVYQRVAHLVLSAVDVGVDNAGDAFVAHYVYVHGDALGVGLARDVGQLVFRPVGNTLVTVRIERIHKSCAAFHRAVHEQFDPVWSYTRRSVFLAVGGFGQCSIDIHPTLYFVGCAEDDVHVAVLVHLMGSLIEILVEEIVGPTVEIHGVALFQQLFLDAGHVLFGYVNGKEFLVVYKGAYIGAGLFFEITGRYAVSIQHNLAASYVCLQWCAVGFHNTCLDQ